MIRPLSTYRLQLHGGFTLDHAAAVAPTLARLGATHLYLSPILQSTPGSRHGYDTTDPSRIDADRGGSEAFDRLAAACRELGLGLVLDIVPNHMDVATPHNPWWWSVLRLGRASPYAAVFDIDWEAPDAGGRLVLPVLGADLRQEARTDDLALVWDGREICARYHENRWPLRPRSAAHILRDVSADGDALAGVARLLDAIDAAAADGADPADLEHRLRGALGSVARALDDDARVVRALGDHLKRLSRPDALTPILDDQHYRPMFWREGADRINYRRFFDIDSLAAVRAEDPSVFELTHGLILELAALPEVHGLRVDHPDGLRDPAAYFERLDAATGLGWIAVEKILERDERLPDDWRVAGGTGYDFLNDALAVLVDPAAERPLTELYERLTGRTDDFENIARVCKRRAAMRLLRADLDRLVRLARAVLPEPVAAHPGSREGLREHLAELAACLTVYRTYLSADQPEAADVERGRLQRAVDSAARSRPDLDPDLLAAIGDLLAAPGDRPEAQELAVRFQQLSAPATAKGVEDTAFYRYHRFVALSEVGGDPSAFGMTPAEFHERTLGRAERWPESMLTTSTHDTKRSEDVRARLATLSEIPGAWAERANAWMDAAAGIGRGAVDPNDVYLLLQTIVGAWPIDAERLRAYMIKAARESKLRTSWRNVDERYEHDLAALIDRLLADASFVASVEGLAATLRRPGRIRSLAQAALRLACPGVADTYQGCELWDLSLVDPDNRRPVDFDRRRTLLDALESASSDAIWRTLDDPADPGAAKLWLTHTLLTLRRRRPDVLGPDGAYTPIRPEGAHADRLLAFSRAASDQPTAFVAVLPLRSVHPIEDARVTLPEAAGAWIDRCSGRRVAPGERAAPELLAAAPLAILVDEEAFA